VPANAVVSARIDRRLKQEAEAVLAAKGLSVSEALRQMMMRIAQEKALPFELTVPSSKPTQERKRKMYDIVTAEMRHHVAFRTLNYLGFRGYRAAIAARYARPEGATQAEVNQAARSLGSPQKDYRNMLHQAIKWGHKVIVWDDPARGGKVYKLIYNPNHSGPGAVDPPRDWREMNTPKTPPGLTATPYKPYRS
jgi:addiction module RelB/DinJ family antitoxin